MYGSLVIVMIATSISRMQNAEVGNRRSSKIKVNAWEGHDDDLRDVLLRHRAKIASNIVPEQPKILNPMWGSYVIE